MYHQPSLAKADTSLVDKPSPIATAVFPDCGGDCDEIARCYVSCAQSTGLQINSCFCNLLSWPTACANQCSQPDDRTSIAAWYWDVCPSKMDSELGQIGMTRWANPAVTADSWAIQTPQGSATMTGYNCYYCSRCSGVEDTGSIQPTSSSSSSGSPQQSNPNQGLLVKILVPICVFILLLAMMILIMRYHLRNHPQNRGNDEQLANLLQVIMDLLDQQPPPAAQQAHQNNAMILEIRRANESIADMRTWVTDIVGRLNQQQPAGGNANQVQDNELREALREYLTCPICSEIFHNPVTAISDATRQGTGCCKAILSLSSHIFIY